MGLFDDIGQGVEDLWGSLTGATAREAQQAEQAAQAQKIAAMQTAAGVYGDYRQQQQQARMNALSNISTAYQPANNALATLYGGGTGQVPFAARPAGYRPITAGGAQGQSAYRPQPISPALTQRPISSYPDPTNPPGMTESIQRPTAAPIPPARPAQPLGVNPTQSQLTAAAGGSAPNRVQQPSSAQSVMAAALGASSGGGGMRTLAGPAPVNPSILGALSGSQSSVPARPIQTGAPSTPQGLPRSEVPILPGMNGAPSGSTGSVTGSGAMGLQPGAQISGSSPARPAVAPAPAVAQTGAAGVSFQPGQMLQNPFNSGPPGMSTLSRSMPSLMPPVLPQTTRAPLPVSTAITKEDILAAAEKAKRPPGTQYTAPLVTPKTAFDTIRRNGGVSTLTGANWPGS